MGRWSALQHAIEQGWFKGNSRLEAQNLASNILSWFTHSKNLDVYDLETLLHQAMDSFKLVHQEGSVEEVSIYFITFLRNIYFWLKLVYFCVLTLMFQEEGTW